MSITWIHIFQHINYVFAMCSCYRCILFAIIWHKKVKQSMACATVRRKRGCFLVCGTEVFKRNTFNRHRPIITTVLRFNLVRKAGYYTFWIITTVQYILGSWTTLEFISASVSTVIRLQQYVHVVGELQFSNLKECISLYEIRKLMTPSLQTIFLYKVYQ